MSNALSARRFLQESIKDRVETGAVLSAILDLGLIPESSSVYGEVSRLSDLFIRQGGHRMPDRFRQVDRLSVSDTDSFSVLFSDSLTESLEGVSDSQYAEAVKTAVRGGLAALGVPDGLSAGEALSGLNRTNFTVPESWSKNRWKKAVRFLARVEKFMERFEQNVADREASILSKSRLSLDVEVEKLDDKTLAAVAYLVARANRRSVFGLSDQSKAFDTVHETLVGELDENSAWFELAKVYPTGVAFQHLSGEEKAELLNIFFDRMVKYGLHLKGLYEALPQFSQDNFITCAGADTSRWNTYSGAYNTMRAAWVNLTLFVGAGKVFESFLPGKAPRIMAADLMRARMWDGQEPHSDEALFFRFPKPWEIISGEAVLDVEEARQFDGWAAPLQDVGTEIPELEPALVHGVVVDNPVLAELFRKSGMFSGNKR